ncbi:unnamed protein product [Musa hybrid cultivar]
MPRRPSIKADEQFLSFPHTQIQVQASVLPTTPADASSKRECFGVLCTTYDLKAVMLSSSWKSLINIAISGAAGMISNHLLFKLASGEVFGSDKPIALKLLGSKRSFQALEGVAMELEDSLYPLLRGFKHWNKSLRGVL